MKFTTAKNLVFRYDDPKLTPKLKARSIPFFLPRTVLEFRCTAAVQITEPCLLCKPPTEGGYGFDPKAVEDAATKLGIVLNTRNTPVRKCSIKDPALTSRGERDPDALYFIKLRGGVINKTEYGAQFSSDGVAGSVSVTEENKALTLITKTIEFAAGVAGKVIGVAAKAPATVPANLLEAVEQGILHVRPLRQELLSTALTSANVETLNRALEELAKLEARLLDYFKCPVREVTFPIVCTITPPMRELEKLPSNGLWYNDFRLFEFGASEGFKLTQNNVVRNGPVPSEYRTEGECKRNVVLYCSVPADDIAALRALAPAKAEKGGLPYRVPARVFLEVRDESYSDSPPRKVLITKEELLAQWSVTRHLPPKIGALGSTLKPTYYTETGALKELALSGTPLSPEGMHSLGKAAGSIMDAAKAKAEKDDELRQLKRQADILEQKDKIRGLQEKLKAP